MYTSRLLPPRNGFTLIEIIAGLLILGIVGAAGSMGLMDAVQGFVSSADNNNLAIKAQMALTRINLELSHINFDSTHPLAPGQGVRGSSGTSISYDANFGHKNAAQSCCLTTPKDNPNTLNYVSPNLLLNGQVLCDDVTNFQLAYLDNPTATQATTWGAGSRIILVSMTLRGANNVPQTFTARITPKFR